MTKKLLITFGCSWTYGVGIGYSQGMSESDFRQIAQDKELADRLSFRGLLCKQFDLYNKNFSIGGSSNQKQFRFAKQYFCSNEFTTDTQLYDQIIVLWGITSLYRNELYSNTNDTLINFFYNNNIGPDKKFINQYFKHVFNETNELRELSLEILFWDNFFRGHNVKNYWFDTFNHHDYFYPFDPMDYESRKQNYKECAGEEWPLWGDFLYNNLDGISSEIHKEIHNTNRFHWADSNQLFPYFPHILDLDKQPRDIASYLAVRNGSDTPDKKTHQSDWKVDADRIKYLKDIGLVNPISLHPTKIAHEQIAEYFSDKIEFN